MSTATAIQARETLPDLGNPKLYMPFLAVPILDSHYKDEMDDDGVVQSVYCSQDQLEVIARNSQLRADHGDYALVRVGHVNVKLNPHEERKQPPIIGYIPKFYIGERYDKKVILVDMYIKVKNKEDMSDYPRRSSEIFDKGKPNGYIDAVALLNRPPERDLGLITYSSERENEIGPPIYHDFDNTGDKKMDPEALLEAIRKVMKEELAALCADEEEEVNPTENPSEMMDETDPSMMEAETEPVASLPAKSAETFPGATSSSLPAKKFPPKKEEEHMQKSDNQLEALVIEMSGKLDSYQKATNGKFEAFAKSANAKIGSLERNLAQKDETIRVASRREKLLGLRRDENISLDLKEELETCSKMDEVEFAKHINRIRKNYSRAMVGSDFIEVDDVVGEDETRKDAHANRLTTEEVNGSAVYLYSKQHPEIDRGSIVKSYLSDVAAREQFAKKFSTGPAV